MMDKEEIRQAIRNYLQEGSPEVKNLIKEIVEKDPKYIFQSEIFTDVIKERHVGEGVRYLRSGALTDRPASGEKAGSTYYDTTNDSLFMWTGSAWSEVTPDLSSYVTLTGTQTLTNKTLTGPRATITTASDGATVTFDLSLGPIHTVTLGGNRTLAVLNSAAAKVFIIRLLQDGTGSKTVT